MTKCQVIQLRCRARSDLTWRVGFFKTSLPTSKLSKTCCGESYLCNADTKKFVQVERPEGTIVDIESRARKLKVLSKLIASNNNNNSNSKKAKGSVKAGWQMLRERRKGQGLLRKEGPQHTLFCHKTLYCRDLPLNLPFRCLDILMF